MERRIVVVILALIAVATLGGCQSLAPRAESSPSVAYNPVEIQVDAPDSLRPNETGTVTVTARLKLSHPSYVRPPTPVTAIDNVTVIVDPSKLVVRGDDRPPTRLGAGETVTWSVSVCAASPIEEQLTVTLDGEPQRATGDVSVPSTWTQSTGEAMLTVASASKISTRVNDSISKVRAC